MNDVRDVRNAHMKKESENTKENPLQWHPAFFSEMQIELREEAENLCFENEHQLGTKPKEIDILIIKKNSDIPIKKNIGQIFRKYNIIEYKSPEDSFTINDFYKVLGYTYFYKADTLVDDEIKLEELTVTFVSRRFPRKLFQHLKDQGKELMMKESGIWYTQYNFIPIQFIVTAQLSEEENFWLKNLTNDLKDKDTVKELLERYREHKNDIHYNSVMNIIVKANKNMFNQEDEIMCEALLEILQDKMQDDIMCETLLEILQDKMQDKIDAMLDEARLQSKEEGVRMGEERGIHIGEEKGLHLAKMVLRMNANGTDYKTIASKCMLTVDEVRDILDF